MTHNQIRGLRKGAGLTQKELSYLTGLDSATSVSRIERSMRAPNLTTLIALQLVFRRPAEELFPELVREVERMVIIRASALDRKVAKDQHAPNRQHRRKVLRAIAEGQCPIERTALWKTINTDKK